jgi:hypothetical protein
MVRHRLRLRVALAIVSTIASTAVCDRLVVELWHRVIDRCPHLAPGQRDELAYVIEEVLAAVRRLPDEKRSRAAEDLEGLLDDRFARAAQWSPERFRSARAEFRRRLRAYLDVPVVDADDRALVRERLARVLADAERELRATAWTRPPALQRSLERNVAALASSERRRAGNYFYPSRLRPARAWSPPDHAPLDLRRRIEAIFARE